MCTFLKESMGNTKSRVSEPVQKCQSVFNVQSINYRGLDNNPGENNCFLNAVVQTLWHVAPFRRAVGNYMSTHTRRAASESNEEGNDQLLQALCSLFDRYDESDKVCPLFHSIRSHILLTFKFEHGTNT